MFDAGYAGVDWPTEGGGRGASPVEELIFKEELERAHAPYVGVNFVGLLHAGPTVIAEGTPEQRSTFLPPILRGDHVWCQGFSEPNAGSDLASMRTRAVRDGDDYVVSGQKIWTSHAEVADYCELLVRTGPEDSRHRGITWLILPMDSPGVDIRPLHTIAGSTEFAELFLDEVRVPVANRVGEENDGWRVTMVTLSFERGTAFVGDLLEAVELLAASVELAKRTGAWADPGTRRQAGHIKAELDALWALTKRNVSQAARTGIPGVGGHVLQARLLRDPPQAGRVLPRPAGPGRTGRPRPRGCRRCRPAAGRHHGRRLVAGHLAHHRRGHLPDPAQHRGRADPGPAQRAPDRRRVEGLRGRPWTSR